MVVMSQQGHSPNMGSGLLAALANDTKVLAVL
jgi:hypothetical protein